MGFLKKLTALLPIGKKVQAEYFFAVSIGAEQLTAALWTVVGKELKILEIASQPFSDSDEILNSTDRLLDQVLGLKEIEPHKILFGVPHSWVYDDNLKDEYLNKLRSVVKELELTPMAYVVVCQAITHFLEKGEGVPPTAILIGLQKLHLTVAVVKAGKIEGVKTVGRKDSPGEDIEKALLTFTDIETLPSKILIYGAAASGIKNQLLSFPWMAKLPFLHFPKIDVLDDDIEIKSVCFAGGSEINKDISYTDHPLKKLTKPESQVSGETQVSKKATSDFGFMVGDISKKAREVSTEMTTEDEGEETELVLSDTDNLAPPKQYHRSSSQQILAGVRLPNPVILLTIVSIVVILIGAYIFLPKADIKIYVEPKILEKDAQVVADPNQKTIDEDGKIIPGQIVETEVSDKASDQATGTKEIGDPAKGMVKIYNATDKAVSLKVGQILTSSDGIEFKLDSSVEIASKSASAAIAPSQSSPVGSTAVKIGADGNIPSSVELKVGSYSKADVVAKTEGNFSGGTSKQVTVVSSEDQKKLLAALAGQLRRKAQQKLQEKFPDKKILEEALSEEITKKSYNKNIGDQANEFSLNMTVRFEGTAFDDNDLKAVVSKLVTTQVPDDFKLSLSETETQADVAKLEKGGKLVFLAKFKAKLIPKIDSDKIKNKIIFKSPDEVENLLKEMDNVLGSEIKLTPNLPKPLERLPILANNIQIEVGLK